MPFKLGVAPIRRSIKYLENCPLVFREGVKIMTIHYNVSEKDDPGNTARSSQWSHLLPKSPPESFATVLAGEHHRGAQDFVFWNLPQVQYKNPEVQIVTVKNLTPSPFITCYMEDGETVLFDVDSQSNTTILQRLVKTLGKSESKLQGEALASVKKENRANFGRGCERFCLCSVPGQLPCPGLVPVPKQWRGKYYLGLVNLEEEEE